MDDNSNDKAPNGSQPTTSGQADATAAASETAPSESSPCQDLPISRRDLVAKIPAAALGVPLALRESAAEAGVYNALFMRSSASEGGTLWAWGNNDYGQLGIDNITDVANPTQVGNLSTWINAASSGSTTASCIHMAAIRADGTLWTCGQNNYGQLGNSSSVDRSTLIQVGTLSNWSQVSCGHYTTTALRADGTLWSWGYNSTGECGLGLTGGKRSSPVQVGSLSSWAQVSAGSTHTVARRSDGTLWATGRATMGCTGQGDNVERSSFVQIGNLSTWSTISSASSHVLAIRTDGTLWSWGSHTFGKLGHGNGTVPRSSPVQVGSLSSWREISAADTHSVAIRSDGTLWVFGMNTSGGLGIGDIIHRSSPVQLGTLSTWSTAGGRSSSWAIRTDGTLWAWGDNTAYILGIGAAGARSSPVQVGSLSSWVSVVGDESGFAIRN